MMDTQPEFTWRGHTFHLRETFHEWFIEWDFPGGVNPFASGSNPFKGLQQFPHVVTMPTSFKCVKNPGMGRARAALKKLYLADVRVKTYFTQEVRDDQQQTNKQAGEQSGTR